MLDIEIKLKVYYTKKFNGMNVGESSVRPNYRGISQKIEYIIFDVNSNKIITIFLKFIKIY